MSSDAEPGHASGTGAASGPTSSLWLRLLVISSAAAASALLLTAVAAAIFNGGSGALSGLFGGAVVMVFFAISLAIGHIVGRNNPSGAIGMFVATYFVKVVGFGVVLFLLGEPAWLHERWFLIGAVVAVVAWQTAEIIGFAKARLQLYDEPQTTESGTDV
jgi:ATP synthase protein I